MSTKTGSVEQTTEVVTAESAPAETNEVVETEQVVNTESTPVDEIDSDEHEETVDTGSAPGAQKRIKQLAAQRKIEQKARIKAELEREYYKGLAENRSATQPEKQAPAAQVHVPQPIAPVPPVLDNFENFEDYERAKDEYVIQTAEYRMMARQNQQQAQRNNQQKAAEISSKLNTAAKEDPAFAQIWTNKALWDTLPINASMAEVISASPDSPELIKWVHANRQEATRIANMTPAMAAREIALVEASIKNAPKPTPPKRVSAAPEPIQTINPSTSNTIDEDNLPMEEYYKRRTKQMLGR